MLAFADVIHLFAYEFSSLRAGGFSLARVFACTFYCSLFRHGTSVRNVGGRKRLPQRTRCNSFSPCHRFSRSRTVHAAVDVTRIAAGVRVASRRNPGPRYERSPSARLATPGRDRSKEARNLISNTEQSPLRDAGLISAYGTVRTLAKALGVNEVASLLNATLTKEKKAETSVNRQALRSAPVSR
jgi:hypothetical protein